MSEIVVFHSAYGLRPSVLDFAETLRGDAHTVHTPDLYDGAVFDTLEEAVAERDEVGIGGLIERASAAVKGLPAELAYAGFSMGCGPAQLLAQTRPGARGAFLMHGALPSQALGAPWPADVPIEVHGMEGDALFDVEAARRLTSEAAEGTLHLYPGEAHLFADAGLPDYDQAAAALLRERALAFFTHI
ncbi:MAG: hypothetical protein AVDCRST_MAG69-2207 [uncultured Solirubrobacteraceae bacterium]|uniref:Dienelactone hydrolase domain-containing protein n=1 Tax=uncultured Solirubrobacteraceae bacterium TaxID=1162706 RepID=A0A6J4SV47_9ACTN|nr:MAG: hypothetical protein AVDCRST_MAG69-2207 [uncultured Solirubrobacteraceae bacterium]